MGVNRSYTRLVLPAGARRRDRFAFPCRQGLAEGCRTVVADVLRQWKNFPIEGAFREATMRPRPLIQARGRRLARRGFPGRPAAGGGAGWRAALALAFALAASAGPMPQAMAATPQPPGAPAGESSDDAERLRRFTGAMVRIEARAIDGAASAESLGRDRVGSGVIIRPGLVLTIGYLLLETEQVEVTSSSGRRVPATVAGYDHASGFGLVRTVLPLDGQPLPLGDSDQVAERQVLLTQGQGEPHATRLLVVSRRPFSGDWEYLIERPIYTFPPVNNWSGSALMTADGQLVGIGSLIVGDAAGDARGLPGNLFVPVNLLKPIIEELLADGRRRGPAQPWLGMATEAVRGHLIVSRVSREGPAAAAGVRAGDIVLALDDEPVDDRANFYRRLWKLGPAGTEVRLRMLQGGTVRELKLRSIDRMDSLARPAGI